MVNNVEEVSLSQSTVINEPETQSNTVLKQENSVPETKKKKNDVEVHSTPISVKNLMIIRCLK